MKNLLTILIEATAFQKGEYAGKAIFFAILGCLGIYLVIKMMKEK